MPLLIVGRLLFSVLAPIAVLLALGVASASATTGPSPVAVVTQVDEDEVSDEQFDDFGDELASAEFDAFVSDEEDLAEDEEEDLSDDEVAAIEQATGELGRAKRAATAKVARLSRSADVLRPCLNGGPGWKQIRSIDHAPQRALYTAAARRLLADMKLLIDGQQPRIVVFESSFARFVADLRTAPVSDPTLREAIAAQARRLASYRDVRSVKADCAVFNKLTKHVREFPTDSAAQIVRADYRAAPLARKIERNISNQLAKIERRHGITHRDADTLSDAAELLVELGGEPGYATGFQYALSLR